MPLADLKNQATRRSLPELVEHMKDFELRPRFSAGIWYFSPASNRFHAMYKPELGIEQRLEVAACMAAEGLEGIEAHYPNEINENNLDLWKRFSDKSGVRIISVIPLLFHDAQFEFGSLSSPIESVRKTAIKRTVAALRLNKELDTDFAILWSGIDGYENAFGIDLAAMRDRFAKGLAEAMDAVPGVRIAFEPKPYEPRGHHLYGTTAEALLLCLKVESLLQDKENRRMISEGHSLVCLNPEIGHMLMAYEDLPYAFSLVLEYGRLAHAHINSQPLGNFDQDLNAGAISPESLEAAMYVMKMHGYQGYFGIDINPERMPVAQALRNNMDAVRSAVDRVNSLDHEKVLWAAAHPQIERGWLESYLIRARSSRPDLLPPIGKLPVE